MKKMIRAVSMCASCLVIITSIYSTGVTITNREINKQAAIEVMAVAKEIPKALNVAREIPDDVTVTLHDIPDVTSGTMQFDTLPSVRFKNDCGRMINTNEVNINTEALLKAYNSDVDFPDWDKKEQIHVLSTLWEFLVNQQGVSPMNAAGILGSIAIEGDFGEEESSYRILSSITDARNALGSGTRGYGIAQWTYGPRQITLLEYYENANKIYPDDFTEVKLVAECCMLLEEVKGYSVFEDITRDTSIEDATGRFCLEYEKYKNYKQQWSYENGMAKLISSEGSGASRLEYAKNIYNYFTR